jgi:very-short-patch-repair endonuclease
LSTERARGLRRAQTDAEGIVWSYLRSRRLDGWKFKRQVPKGRYIVDFCCNDAKLIIELDGDQHAEDSAVAHDVIRTKFLQESGYRVVRFWNNEVYDELDAVLDAIYAKLQELPLPDNADHSLQPSGRGLE